VREGTKEKDILFEIYLQQKDGGLEAFLMMASEKRAARRLKKKGLVESYNPDIEGVRTMYRLTPEGIRIARRIDR
jgi:DNA-binding MarR family transcriptional regulator